MVKCWRCRSCREVVTFGERFHHFAIRHGARVYGMGLAVQFSYTRPN